MKTAKKKPRSKKAPYYCKELAEYCAERGRAALLAKRMKVGRSMMSQWIKGTSPVPPARCPEFVRITGGWVTKEALRKDIDWSEE